MTGTYTDIVGIIAPSSAMPGEPVSIEAQVKNIHPAGTITITATGKIDDTPIYFGSVGYQVPYGSTQSYYETFTMLSGGVAVHVWSWVRATDGSWIVDDHTSVVVADVEAPEYPASDIADFDLVVPIGAYNLGAEIHFTGVYKHKGVAISGSLAISLGTGVWPTFSEVADLGSIPVSFSASYDWKSADLSGVIVLPATLVSGQTYSVRGTLRTDDGAQEIDTDWSVITVIEGVPGEVAGEIVYAKIRIGWTEYNLPVPGVQLGDDFKLIVKVKNTSTVPFAPYLYYKITRPNEPSIERIIHTGSLSLGEEHTFYEDPEGLPTYFEVTSSGTWLLYLELQDENGNVLDTYQGEMFTVASEEPPNGEPVEGIGKITEVTIIHGTNTFGNEFSPPLSGVKTGEWFKIKVSGTNEASGVIKLGLHYIITKPSGATIERTIYELDFTEPGGSTTFIEGPAGIEDAFNIDQLGNWSLYLEWLGVDGQVADTWQGDILTGVEQGAEAFSILELIPMMIMVMMMSMIMSFVEEPAAFIEKAGKVAAPVVEIFAARRK